MKWRKTTDVDSGNNIFKNPEREQDLFEKLKKPSLVEPKKVTLCVTKSKETLGGTLVRDTAA